MPCRGNYSSTAPPRHPAGEIIPTIPQPQHSFRGKLPLPCPAPTLLKGNYLCSALTFPTQYSCRETTPALLRPNTHAGETTLPCPVPKLLQGKLLLSCPASSFLQERLPLPCSNSPAGETTTRISRPNIPAGETTPDFPQHSCRGKCLAQTFLQRRLSLPRHTPTVMHGRLPLRYPAPTLLQVKPPLSCPSTAADGDSPGFRLSVSPAALLLFLRAPRGSRESACGE